MNEIMCKIYSTELLNTRLACPLPYMASNTMNLLLNSSILTYVP